MSFLFEQSDYLNRPIECFYYDTADLPFPVKPHWHYFIELIYVLNGNTTIYSGDIRYDLGPDELMIIQPQSVHSIYPYDEKPLKYAVFKFDLNKFNSALSYAPKMRNIFKNAVAQQMPVVFRKKDTDIMKCRSVFEKCIEESNNQKYGCDVIISSEISQMLINIIRIWQKHGFSADAPGITEESHYDIDSITEYIDQHMNENIQVADIAAECGLSYSCFAKKFQQLYAMSCKKYIEMMRIFKVEEFLLFTDFDLNYISQETGFSDCSHMIKCFRRYRNCTPKQFRMKQRKTEN